MAKQFQRERSLRSQASDGVTLANPVALRSLPDDLSSMDEARIPTRQGGPSWPDWDRGSEETPPASTRNNWDNPARPDYTACDPSREAKKVAVLVAHGMGQQVPFETLDAVVEAITRAHGDATGAGKPTGTEPAVVRYVSFGNNWAPRAELTLQLPSDARGGAVTRDVHLYEAYWAPVTEGEVKITDVFLFLCGAAWRGLVHGRGGFGRFVFGKYRPCELSRIGWVLLLFILTMILITAFAFITFWTGAATQALAVIHFTTWRDWAMPTLWLATVVSFSAVLMILFGGTALSYLIWIGRSMRTGGTRQPVRKSAQAGVFILVFAALSYALVRVIQRAVIQGEPWITLTTPRLIVAMIALVAAAYVVNLARSFIVQYVGDVAVYVSAHRVSRFGAIREKIQSIGRSLARDVYSAHGPDGTLEYDQVIVVGHSLGSVVAYDMLNDSIQRDLAMMSQFGRSLDVVARTALLLTFGSPLDKIAFFFRTQKDSLPTREALAAAAQPLIRDLSLRPHNWVNIWSPYDWISGSLDYYDPDGPWRRGYVINRIDYDASLLVSGAHTGYWEHPLFSRVLYEGVTA